MVAEVFDITRQRVGKIVEQGKDPVFREVWVRQLQLTENPPTKE